MKHMVSRYIHACLSLLFVTLAATANEYDRACDDDASSKHRMIVLTDIEADPDDTQTLIRLLLYANQIDIEGIVATTSVHQKDSISPESIHRVVDAYGEIHRSLRKHEAGFPKANVLKKMIRAGSSEYGMQGVGKDKSTPGSRWIIETLERNDPRPLWISVWGGPNTLAQALYTLKQTKTPEQLKKLIKKLRVYTISDQDDSASWIRNTFPDLFYIVSPGGYGAATWTGIMTEVKGIDNSEISNRWIADNIQQNHGVFGKLYPDVAYGMEGDTPAWLNLIPNGLTNPEFPNWGGWGGRYEFYTPKITDTDPKGFTGGVPVPEEKRPIWTNAIDSYKPIIPGTIGRAFIESETVHSGYKETIWRWRREFQNDFAARLDWTFNDYELANHPPIPVLNHACRIEVSSEESFYLDASRSSDPDEDSLSFYWLNYPEAGTLKQQKLDASGAANMARVHFKAPQVYEKQSLHFILKVTDKGTPPLTRYKRVIVDVIPKK